MSIIKYSNQISDADPICWACCCCCFDKSPLFGFKPDPKAPKGVPLDTDNALKFPAAPVNGEGEEVELGNAPVVPFIGPPVEPVNIDARNGFAAPPVICGRRPTPRLGPPPNPPNDGAPVG